MIAIVAARRTWSIAAVKPTGDLTFYCGDEHGWVSPASALWRVAPSVRNVKWPTLAEAVAFATKKKWITAT